MYNTGQRLGPPPDPEETGPARKHKNIHTPAPSGIQWPEQVTDHQEAAQAIVERMSAR